MSLVLGTLSLVTAPAAESILLEAAKRHCRVESNDEDTLITDAIVAAREYVEQDTGRALITQTWDWKLGGWPCSPFEVPRAPLASVSSVTYLDGTGTSQVWATTNYRVLTYSGPQASPGRIGLGYGISYPTLYGVDDPLTIRFMAGYGAAGTAVPAKLRQAMLLLIAEMYESRRASVIGTISTEVELSVSRLLSPYCVLRW